MPTPFKAVLITAGSDQFKRIKLCGKMKLSQPQMRLLIELLPYHAPKLTAIASTTLDNASFAALLDRAIARSAGAKLIEKPEPPVEQPRELPAEELKGPNGEATEVLASQYD